MKREKSYYYRRRQGLLLSQGSSTAGSPQSKEEEEGGFSEFLSPPRSLTNQTLQLSARVGVRRQSFRINVVRGKEKVNVVSHGKGDSSVFNGTVRKRR